MTYPFFRLVLVVSTMLLYASLTLADAIVRSRAMFADTIAEYFVEDDHVRLELEISDIDGVWKLTGLEIVEEQRL